MPAAPVGPRIRISLGVMCWGEKPKSRNYSIISMRVWRAATDDDEHYVYAIALL
jgi:hypothetical protein